MLERLCGLREVPFPNLSARILSLLLPCVPPASHVFVKGMYLHGPEGNVIEVVRSIVALTNLSVVWPGAPSPEYLEAMGIPTGRVRRLASHRSVAAIWAFLRARAVFCTIGLYGNPVPAPLKPIVLVWHGDGFKDGLYMPRRTLRGPCATYLVSASQVTGKIKAKLARLPMSRILLVGNPRVRQMFSPVSPSQLVALGIDPSRPFVLWMPTFRIFRDGWIRDTADAQSDRALTESAVSVFSRLVCAGIGVVTKPHPGDGTSREVPGAVTVDNAALERQRIPLYALLGASAGLISDYSSVWLDYLALDRPIAFLVHDIHAYSQGRGLLRSDLTGQYPGETLDSPEGVERFIADVRTGGTLGAERRATFRETIGFVSHGSSAEDVVRAALDPHELRFDRSGDEAR